MQSSIRFENGRFDVRRIDARNRNSRRRPGNTESLHPCSRKYVLKINDVFVMESRNDNMKEIFALSASISRENALNVKK